MTESGATRETPASREPKSGTGQEMGEPPAYFPGSRMPPYPCRQPCDIFPRPSPLWPALMEEIRTTEVRKMTQTKIYFEEVAKAIHENPRDCQPRLERRSGTVITFDKDRGFGFIKDLTTGRDLYVNRRSVKRSYLPGYMHNLREGEQVEFTLAEGLRVYPSASTTTTSSPPVCGSPVLSSRIVGGTDALDGRWPWQVSVQYYGDNICGGSLISRQWVMSAAHCFPYYTIEAAYTLYFGLFRLSEAYNHTQSSSVSNIYIHPNYTGTGSPGDIALVKLSSPVNYTSYIMPICLPTASVIFPEGLECWVTGWGSGEDGPMNCSRSYIKMIVSGQNVRLVELSLTATCDQLYHMFSDISSSQTIILDDMICSGYIDGGKDSCQGDSGGPLVCKVNSVWYEAGIVSWGIGCVLPYLPGVYTLVPAYAAWIQSYVPDATFIDLVDIPVPTPADSTPEGLQKKLKKKHLLEHSFSNKLQMWNRTKSFCKVDEED
ncbi:serine protease 33-like [Bufo bufo]|uniref:serine protease 33-like n=1 Tax=Bufo bufo TaxID=8384 RepID=UPI001ABE0F17|nr:serine protease 33-like [Bufo bufo]